MNIRTQILLILLIFYYGTLASDEFTLLKYPKNEFQPAQGEVFIIPVKVTTEATVKIDIFTPDGDLVRQLISEKPLKIGKHRLSWDGKDSKGIVVPDEAYYPVAYANDNTGKTVTFSKRNTGGEVIYDLQIKITPEKNISFQLPYPARVLSRAGIKGGPMLRTLSNWEPKNTGKIVIRWDGFDADKLKDLRTNKKLSIMTRAYKLPEFSIITSGNRHLDYRKYRETLAKKTKAVSKQQYALERDGKRIERHYYYSKDINLNPDVSLKFVEEYPRNKEGHPIINCPCPIQVNLNTKDKIQLQESLYEIAFFIDNEFVSEQEQGYVPFTWRWTPSGLSKGEHILTVNVSGLRGEVGVKSLLFSVH